MANLPTPIRREAFLVGVKSGRRVDAKTQRKRPRGWEQLEAGGKGVKVVVTGDIKSRVDSRGKEGR